MFPQHFMTFQGSPVKSGCRPPLSSIYGASHCSITERGTDPQLKG